MQCRCYDHDMSTEARNTVPATAVEVRGARVHNLQGIDVDVPLNTSSPSPVSPGRAITGHGRALRRRLAPLYRSPVDLHSPSHGQAARADVDTVRHIPAALALRQRPGVPGVRSTFGTSTELLNVVRLMFSRLASHLCPNGHRQEPTLNVAAEEPFDCPECGETVQAPGAEELAFNSGGACPRCEGIGTIREVDDASLIRDPMTIDEGTVIPGRCSDSTSNPKSPTNSASAPTCLGATSKTGSARSSSAVPKRRSTSRSPRRRGCTTSTSRSAMLV